MQPTHPSAPAPARPGLRSRLRAELLLAGAAAGWGAGFVLMKSALASQPVWPTLGWRFALAALLVLPLAWRERAQWRPAVLRSGLLLGLLLFAVFALLMSGLQRTSATNTGLLAGLTVVWIPLITRVWLHRPLPPAAWAGVALCAAGVVAMAGGRLDALGAGDALVVAGSWVSALHMLLLAGSAGRLPSASLTVLQLLVVALLSAALGWQQPPAPPPWEDTGFLLLVAATALLSTALPYAVQTRYQRDTSPMRAAMIFNLEPVFAALLAFWLLHEPLGAQVALAAALIVAGMVVAEWRPRGS
ncbi:DMT family transporter [Aquincola sp. J276]|uniref:DMT family transporter n=1 Tax=Aquincola sp. J276 TaxID=2898432 RepID=UPI002150802C|nr:DMT family transporter [Aquincola sp. J276]MCR5863793.1 DMT family transporter [Aquincola sp. J276]